MEECNMIEALDALERGDRVEYHCGTLWFSVYLNPHGNICFDNGTQLFMHHTDRQVVQGRYRTAPKQT
jgi:hypothetical protein